MGLGWKSPSPSLEVNMDTVQRELKIGIMISRGLTRLQAERILDIAIEYGKPNHGKWEGNT